MTVTARKTDWVPLALALFKFTLAFFVIGYVAFQIATGTQTELTAEKDSVATRLPIQKNSIVAETISLIENKQMDMAMEKCVQIQDEELPDEVKNYFNEFMRYYQKKSKAKKIEGQIKDESFFVNSAPYITEYLSENTELSPVQVLHAGEVIPYFCISNYSEKFTNRQNVNQNIFTLCGQYIQQFVYPQDSPTRMSADIICLEIKTKYYSYPRKPDYLKQVVSLIDEYQKTYSETLGSNGTFHKQRDYLEAARSLCIKRINKKWYNFTIGNIPDYFM
ncbi:MAG: hypothetical protein J5857_02465 [Treponema sp.]|nr:hypothetical protein [Treponema sp.]